MFRDFDNRLLNTVIFKLSDVNLRIKAITLNLCSHIYSHFL